MKHSVNKWGQKCIWYEPPGFSKICAPCQSINQSNPLLDPPPSTSGRQSESMGGMRLLDLPSKLIARIFH